MTVYEIVPGSTELFTSAKKNIFNSYDDLDVNFSSLKEVYVIDVNLIGKILANNFADFKVGKNTIIKNLLRFFTYLDFKVGKETTSFNLNWKIMKHYFGNHYKQYLDYLFELDIFRKIKNTDGSYFTVGKESCKYRISKNYTQNIDYCFFYKKIRRQNIEKNIELSPNKKYEKTILNSYLDFDNYIIDELSNYHFDPSSDKDQEHRTAITINQLKFRLNAAFSILNKRYIKKGEKVDRIYHSFSNLSKTARKHLITPSNNHFIELDIVNSQPTFSIAYFKAKGYEIDNEYLTIVEAGLIYEQFIGLRGEYMKYDKRSKIKYKKYIDMEDRDITKKQFYSSVFFHFKEDHPLNIKFNELFPKTWEVIRTIHKQKYITLASELQNFESELIHSIIPKNSSYYFTLHDAIYFSDIADRLYLKTEIINRFKEIGVNVKVK